MSFVFDKSKSLSYPAYMKDKNVTKILIVEDNHIAQKIARMVVESLNCESDIIGNAAYALQLFSKNRYDLVFIDLGLPDKDGYKVAEEMREIEHKKSLPPIPLIGLSVHTGELKKIRAKNVGMNDYIIKPLTRENCESTFTKYLTRAR